MADSLLIALAVGTALGFLAGLGVGGGSLLILWLTAVADMPADQARVMNLLFFLPTAAIACFLRWKQGKWQGKALLPAIIAGCSAAAVFSRVSVAVSGKTLQILFSFLLLCTGVRELCYRPRKAK